jgi:hypothetical protein
MQWQDEYEAIEQMTPKRRGYERINTYLNSILDISCKDTYSILLVKTCDRRKWGSDTPTLARTETGDRRTGAGGQHNSETVKIDKKR